MKEVKTILRHYQIDGVELIDYAGHSHDPDMWSHAFRVGDKKYILVEVEAIGADLGDEDYEKLKEDLSLAKENLKLVMPKLEQMQTLNNSAGIGIDGHRVVVNADDRKEYKNPNGLDTETTWVLFELNQIIS